jgi:hypothetical protein
MLSLIDAKGRMKKNRGYINVDDAFDALAEALGLRLSAQPIIDEKSKRWTKPKKAA